MLDLNLIVGGMGIVFGSGGFYLLTNWRLKGCENKIIKLEEYSISKMQGEITKIRLTLAKITTKLDIQDDRVEENNE